MSVGFGGFCILGASLYWMFESRAERRYELGAAGHSMGQPALREAIKLPISFWLIVLMCITFYAGIFPFQTFAQKFFLETKHATPQSAALLVGMLPFFSMIGTQLFACSPTASAGARC